jgi:transglycosylase-like protein
MRGTGKRSRVVLGILATVAALGLGALAVREPLARAVRARIEARAARHDLLARIDEVRVGLWPPLRLTGVALEGKGGWRLRAGTIEAWWPGRTRLVVNDAALEGPAGLTVAVESTLWEVSGLLRDDTRLALVEPHSGLILSRTAGPDRREVWTVEAADLPIDHLLDVRRFARPLIAGGIMRGSVVLTTTGGLTDFDLDLRTRDVRLPALVSDGSTPRALGEPTTLLVHVAGTWKRSEGTLDVPRWGLTIDGAALSGSVALRDLDTDPAIDLALDAERVDFARLLRTTGLVSSAIAGPEGTRRPADDAGPAGDLGSAALAARAQGRLSDPASFVVTQRLQFTPPRRVPPAIERLRGPFVHEIVLASGATRAIDVSPASPDFISLSEVPPLFVQTLLLGEDAGFYGHPGIDLREVPAALLTDWARRGAARGASTISQQLAKNLFLSRARQVGRKLQELSLALLLESTLGKDRILEIYLNVIEWGPGLNGL